MIRTQKSLMSVFGVLVVREFIAPDLVSGVTGSAKRPVPAPAVVAIRAATRPGHAGIAIIRKPALPSPEKRTTLSIDTKEVRHE